MWETTGKILMAEREDHGLIHCRRGVFRNKWIFLSNITRATGNPQFVYLLMAISPISIARPVNFSKGFGRH